MYLVQQHLPLDPGLARLQVAGLPQCLHRPDPLVGQ